MRTVRRLYFYTVALVSLEVVIWGVIGLTRTIFNSGDLGRPVNLLAGSLSLTLVGLPVFLIHWWAAQREALKDPEERAARLRAVFFYGVLGGTLVPVLQNALAISNRLTLLALGLQFAPLVGRGQTWSDNLIAIVINIAAAAYIYTILRADWAADAPGNSLVDVRRLYRYLWMLYGLGMTVFGIQQVLRYIFYAPTTLAGGVGYMLADGLALLLAGTPLWIYTWEVVEDALGGPGEQESLLRMVILYLLALGGVGTVLTSTGIVLSVLLRWVLGQSLLFSQILQMTGASISIAMPMGGVWAYYGRRLQLDLAQIPEQPRQAGLRRFYSYILSAFGLVATFYGAQQLLAVIINLLTGGGALWGEALRNQLSAAMASLLVGLPLWWLAWRPMEIQARQMDTSGDHARRSVIRKAYLYLALFASVIGVMSSGGQLIYLVLSQILGAPNSAFLGRFLDQLELLVLFALWLGYHLSVLRRDGRLAWQALTARHAQFPVIILEPGDGDFSEEILLALQRGAPGVPAVVQILAQGIPAPGLSSARAVILPSAVSNHPSEAVRLWLQDFPGERVIVPVEDQSWLWIGISPRGHREKAQQVTQAIRQMAEGQPVHLSAPLTGWTLAAYILGSLFALLLLFGLATSIVSLLTR